MTDKTPSSYFDRAKALQEMILNAQEDLKQLRADALEEMGVETMPKEQAKEVRKDLAEVFAVAKIEVKGEIERRNQAAKMARRKRIAEECGVQLDLLDDTDAGAAQRMARAARTGPMEKFRDHVAAGKCSVEMGGMRFEGNGTGDIKTTPIADKAHAPQESVLAANLDAKLRAKGIDPEATGEVIDDDTGGDAVDEPHRTATSNEAAVMHAGGISDSDYKALTDIPEFLRRC